MLVIPGSELAEVYVTLARLDPAGNPSVWLRRGEALGYGYYPAERPIRIVLPLADAPGCYRLEVTANLRAGWHDGHGTLALRRVAVTDEAQVLRRRRWLLSWVIAGTLAILTLLLFARVPATEVELEFVASEIEFTVPTRQVVIDGMPLGTLGIAGIARIEAPTDDRERPLVADLAGDPPDAVRFVAGPGARTVAVRPEALRWQSSWCRRTRHCASASRTQASRIAWACAARGCIVPVTLQGSVSVGTSQSPPDERIYATPRLVSMFAAGDEIVMDLGLPVTGRNAFAPVIDVNGLSASRINQHVDATGSVVRRVSTIRSGTVYLTSLDDRERKLRTGEVLVLSGVHGEIASLGFTDAGVAVHFRGRVRGMTVGWGEHPRSLMPTWLEWFLAQHGLTLLWGSAIYFLGVMTTLMRLWGVKV